MSDTKLRNGGPAFPHRSETVLTENGGIHIHSRPIDLPGMALRDYFAAKAMVGGINEDWFLADLNGCAKWCYEMADAMLKAREQ